MGTTDLSLVRNRIELQNLLQEAVTQLCCRSIPFRRQLSVEGLLGITVDSDNVILVNLKQLVENDNHMQDAAHSFPDDGRSTSICANSDRTSSSRRKRKITRKAVVNLENNYMDEEEDDEDLNTYFQGGNQIKVDSDINSNVALNLVKRESPQHIKDIVMLKQEPAHDYSRNGSGKKILQSTTLTNEVPNPTEKDPDFVKGSLESTDNPVWNSTVSHSKISGDSQIRRYGAYGYIIHEGNKVMYSCNKCPKLFRNRVSLWRHGVKHKQTLEIQSPKPMNAASFRSHWPCTYCGIVFGSQLLLQGHIQLQHAAACGQTINSQSSQHIPKMQSTSDEISPSANPLQQNSSDVLAAKDHVCAICQQNFPDQLSLWRHKTKHKSASRNLTSHKREGSKDTVADCDLSPSEEATDLSCVQPPYSSNGFPEPALCDNQSDESDPPTAMDCSLNARSSHEDHDDESIPKQSPDPEDIPVLTQEENISQEASPVDHLNDSASVDAAEPDTNGHTLAGDKSPIPGFSGTHTRSKAATRKGNTIGSRPIGNYGTVYSTEQGKYYACNQCVKSFKNRVSLWKHQFKHTSDIPSQ